MDTLPVDLLVLVSSKLEARESKIFSIVNIDVFDIEIYISVREAIQRQEFRVLRYWIRNRLNDVNKPGAIAKYLVAYSKRYDQELKSLMNSNLMQRFDVVIEIIGGAIISNNWGLFISRIENIVDRGTASFGFDMDMSMILAKAIKYKRIEMINHLTGLDFNYLKHIVLEAKFNGDIELLDLIVSKQLFSIQDYNDGMRIMAESNDTAGMRYFLDKGATNIEECVEIIRWKDRVSDLAVWCMVLRSHAGV